MAPEINNEERAKEIRVYRQTLSELKRYLKKLGLEDDPPSEIEDVSRVGETQGKPFGAPLPVYPDSECGDDATGIGWRKLLFNLKSLGDIEPPARYLRTRSRKR